MNEKFDYLFEIYCIANQIASLQIIMACSSTCIADSDIYGLYGWIKTEVKSCVRLYCKIEILFTSTPNSFHDSDKRWRCVKFSQDWCHVLRRPNRTCESDLAIFSSKN